MRAKLLLVAIVVFLAVGALSAETIDLGTSVKGVDVQVLESNNQRTVVKFDIGSFDREAVNIDGSLYYYIRVPKEAIFLNAGEPDLPRVCRSIIIPDDAKMKVNVLSSEYVDLENTPVAPSKGNILRNVNPDDVPYTFGDVYNQDAFYPAVLSDIREPFIIRDFRGTVIELNAFQYNPVQQTLRVYTSVTVEVTNVGPGEINVLHNADRTRVTPEFKQIYERRFINFDFQADKYTMLTEAGDMLIICYDAFMPTMQPFVDWKLQKGIKTTMVGTSTAGTTSSTIKSYIQTFHDTTDNLAWVMLIGDAAQVPSMTASGGASDPSYGKVVGTDNYPDIIVGRFSAETIPQVETQVTRSVEYELNPPVGGDWFHKGAGVASELGAGIGHYGEADYVHMGYIRDDLLAFTYTEVDELYATVGATAAMVAAALNDGRSIVNYCGHGGTTDWVTTGFNNANVNALVNDNMLPFIISVACLNGNFTSTTCFAEAWMRATNGSEPTGAIATYMSSVDQNWAPPMYAQDEAVDLLCAMTRVTMGGICYNGSAYMLEQVGAVTESNTWTIFGDPSILLRTDTPAPMTVNYNPAVFFNVPNYQVEVVAVEGALCAMYADGVLYGSAYTGADGIADITLTQNLPIGGEVTLTVTAFNKQTFTGTVQAASDLAIVHTPLTNTKDTLNDYEINCTIYSSDEITPDDVILHYDAGSGYVDVIMAPLKIIQADYQGYIPAQQAGTSISYFITASNLGGFYDTTDVYTFNVIDYQMILEPDANSITAPVGDTVWYDMRVTNDGVLADDYSLSITGDEWVTEIRDNTGTTQISSTGTLLGDEYLDFKVMVVVPPSFEDEFDEIQLTAASTNSTLTETSTLTTVSAGQPWPIPFTENFATTTFDMTKWESVDEAEINTIGIDEPSAPYSCDLNGQSIGGDAIITEKINLKDETNVVVKYYYERTGGGESPDAGDDLVIEYLDNTDTWQEINRHLGVDPDMTTFEEVELTLPPNAMHAEFRLKISCTATTGAYDDWFVDDIYVGHPSDYEVRIVPSMQSQYGPAGDSAAYTLTIINKGFLDDAFDLSYEGVWNVAFFDEGMSGEISSTAMVPGGDSVDIVVKVEVPDGTPLHTTNMSTIWATSQGDNNMSSYAMIETVSAGFPAAIPWYEIFPDDTLYTQRWFTFEGATVSSAASNPPSAPYSFNLDGGSDTIETQLISLEGQSGVLLSYYYERGGMADPPEAGDNLWVEYKDNTGAWNLLNTHEGGGTAMTDFEYVSLELPPDAHHSGLQMRFRTFGSGAGQDNWYLDNIRVDYPPAMEVSTMAMSETLVQGESAMHELIISNTGMGGLLYNIDLIPHLRSNLFAKITGGSEPAALTYPDYVYADVEKGTDIDFRANPVTRSMGGPDNYGYYWFDSDDPNGPVYEWVDVSATGTDVVGDLDDDSYVGPIPIGFDFPYYGTTYSEVYIGSNGIVGFESASMEARTARPIPTATLPNSILALVWDDLNPDDADNPGAHLYYKNLGDSFVIQLVDYPEYRADPGDLITAEIILFNDGRIRYQYKDIAPGFDLLNSTVGIENQNGDDGLEVVYHAEYLKPNLAIEFFKPYDWLSLSKLEGEILGGESDTIQCMFSTTEDLEPATYTADIIINCNDPVHDPMTLSAELNVVESNPYICGDANGSGGVDVSDAVYTINYIFVSGPAPDPLESADVNCDQTVNVSDAVSIINFVFVGGYEPCDPNDDGIPDC